MQRPKPKSLIEAILSIDPKASKEAVEAELNAADHSKGFDEKAVFKKEDADKVPLLSIKSTPAAGPDTKAKTDDSKMEEDSGPASFVKIKVMDGSIIETTSELKDKRDKKVVGKATDLDKKQPDKSTDFIGWTPLMLAVHIGNYHAVKWLIDKKVDVNFQEKSSGLTALMVAAKSSSPFKQIILELLFTSSAKTELQDVHGFTAFMYAARSNDGTLQLLLKHSTLGIVLIDKQQFSVCAHAVQFKQKENLEFLVTQHRACMVYPDFIKGLELQHKETLAILLQYTPWSWAIKFLSESLQKDDAQEKLDKETIKMLQEMAGFKTGFTYIQAAVLNLCEQEKFKAAHLVLEQLKILFPNGAKQSVCLSSSADQSFNYPAKTVWHILVPTKVPEKNQNRMVLKNFDFFYEAILEIAISKKNYDLCKFLLAEVKVSYWIHEKPDSVTSLIEMAIQKKDVVMLVLLYNNLSRILIKEVRAQYPHIPNSNQIITPRHPLPEKPWTGFLAGIPGSIRAIKGDKFLWDFLKHPQLCKDFDYFFDFHGAFQKVAADGKYEFALFYFHKMIEVEYEDARFIDLKVHIRLLLSELESKEGEAARAAFTAFKSYLAVIDNGKDVLKELQKLVKKDDPKPSESKEEKQAPQVTQAAPLPTPAPVVAATPAIPEIRVTTLLTESAQLKMAEEKARQEANAALLKNIKTLQAAYLLEENAGEKSRILGLLTGLVSPPSVDQSVKDLVMQFIKTTDSYVSALTSTLHLGPASANTGNLRLFSSSVSGESNSRNPGTENTASVPTKTS